MGFQGDLQLKESGGVCGYRIPFTWIRATVYEEAPTSYLHAHRQHALKAMLACN